MKKLAGAPFSLQKGGLWTPFGASAPLLREKRFPADKKNVPRNFKSEFPPNPTVKKITTGYHLTSPGTMTMLLIYNNMVCYWYL
jgi:hypothetical protein